MQTIDFEVSDGKTVDGPAFHGFFKCLSIGIVTTLCVLAWEGWNQGQMQSTLQSSGWVAAALAMMVYVQWHILTSRTRISSDRLEQTWVWNKAIDIRELAFAKLFRIRGMDWLIAPRLYTRSITNKLNVFYASTPEQLAHFERLVTAVRKARAP